MFERFGEVRDVYLPRDYYNQRPKGFGFIEFKDPRDADEAIYRLDGSLVGGRRVEVVRSKQSRKTPREMLIRDDDPEKGDRRGGGYDRRGGDYDRRGGGGDRRGGGGGRDYDRRDRDRSRERSRDRSRDRGGDRRSPPRRTRTRSRSADRGRSPPPREERRASRSASPAPKDRSPVGRSPGSDPGRGRSPSAERAGSPRGSPRGGGGGRSDDEYDRDPPRRRGASGSPGMDD